MQSKKSVMYSLILPQTEKKNDGVGSSEVGMQGAIHIISFLWLKFAAGLTAFYYGVKIPSICRIPHRGNSFKWCFLFYLITGQYNNIYYAFKRASVHYTCIYVFILFYITKGKILLFSI